MLTRLALKNPVAILMVAIAVIVLGVVSFQRISVDLFPKLSMPVVIVGVAYPGAGPKDIEASITYPVERAISSVPNISYIESSSRQGISTVRAYFDWNADIDTGAMDCIQKVQQVMNALPVGAQSPFVIKFDISNMPVIGLTLAGGGLDSREFYDLAYNVIGPQLERIPGVSNANIGGGIQRRINILASRDRLTSRGLTVTDLVNALQSANFLMPSGTMKVGVIDYNLYTETQIEAVPAFAELPVRTSQKGEPAVLVGDVAQVEDGGEDLTNIVNINGRPGVNLMVRKQPGANTVDVVERIMKEVPKLYGVPPGVTITPSFDQSSYIRNSIQSLVNEALMGALLSIAIIYLFLRTFRSTMIIALSIPLSIMATFVMLFFVGGQTLNTFTLGGLALGVGRLLDDSIVVLENIFRNRKNFKTASEAALIGARQVTSPILAATLTTICVFFPVVFLTGIAQQLFIPMVLTIIFSLAASYVVSLTVIPILCSKILPTERDYATDSPKIGERILAHWGLLFQKLDLFYAAALAKGLRHRLILVIVLALLFAASLTLFKQIGSDFFPKTDESQFTVNLKLPVGTRIEETVRAAAIVEEAANAALGEENILTLINDAGVRTSGAGAIWGGNAGPHAAHLRVNLVPPDRRPFSDTEAIDRIRARLAGKLPGVQLYFSTGGIVQRILNFGAEMPIEIAIAGYDIEKGGALAQQILALVQGVNGTADARISREDNYPELDIGLDREKAARLGLTTRDVAQTLLTSMSGNLTSPVTYTDPISGKEYGVNVRFRDEDRNDMTDIESLPLATRAGKIVELRTVADITSASGPVQIDRKNQQRIVRVTANIEGRPLGDVAAEIEAGLKKLELPPGFSVTMGGQREKQQESFRSLLLALVLALMLVYMVMAAQFGSLTEPFIVMFSVPMGVSGVALMLWATDTPLSINAYMGIIMMVGVVLSNGILLVDLANVLQERGTPLFEAVVEAGRTRLRPILMTTLTTILGMLPMAIGIGEGSETNVPLARAVVGGLAVSTLFTLVLIPVLYTIMGRKNRADATPSFTE